MSELLQGAVRAMYHYPIKGLSAQPLPRVDLHAGQGFPFDRIFGLARYNSGFDAANPVPLPKQRFYMLARDARLAALRTHLDTETLRFTIHTGDQLVLVADLSGEVGAKATVDFFSSLFNLAPEQRPVLARADPHRFTDGSVDSPAFMNAISLINVNSCEELGRRIGRSVDPLRFRANLYFDGWPPFSELDLVDREILVGEVRLRVLSRTGRCAATEVNPDTAQRDIPVPVLLKQNFGHVDMGVYAEVLNAGAIAPGTAITAADQVVTVPGR
jgi:uncharacterized protein YcbX